VTLILDYLLLALATRLHYLQLKFQFHLQPFFVTTEPTRHPHAQKTHLRLLLNPQVHPHYLLTYLPQLTHRHIHHRVLQTVHCCLLYLCHLQHRLLETSHVYLERNFEFPLLD